MEGTDSRKRLRRSWQQPRIPGGENSLKAEVEPVLEVKSTSGPTTPTRKQAGEQQTKEKPGRRGWKTTREELQRLRTEGPGKSKGKGKGKTWERRTTLLQLEQWQWCMRWLGTWSRVQGCSQTHPQVPRGACPLVTHLRSALQVEESEEPAEEVKHQGAEMEFHRYLVAPKDIVKLENMEVKEVKMNQVKKEDPKSVKKGSRRRDLHSDWRRIPGEPQIRVHTSFLGKERCPGWSHDLCSTSSRNSAGRWYPWIKKQVSGNLMESEPFDTHLEWARQGARLTGTMQDGRVTTYSRLRWRESVGVPGPVRSRKFPYGYPSNSAQQDTHRRMWCRHSNASSIPDDGGGNRVQEEWHILVWVRHFGEPPPPEQSAWPSVCMGDAGDESLLEEVENLSKWTSTRAATRLT